MEPEEKKAAARAGDPSVEIEASKSHCEGESFELKVSSWRMDICKNSHRTNSY